MCPGLCKMFVRKVMSECHLSGTKQVVSLHRDKEISWKWLVIYSSRDKQLISDEARIQGLTLSPLTTLFLIIKKMYYLHLKEKEESSFLNSLRFLRTLIILMSVTDLLNYSLFLLFNRFYSERFFFQRENSKQLLKNSCHHFGAIELTLITSVQS